MPVYKDKKTERFYFIVCINGKTYCRRSWLTREEAQTNEYKFLYEAKAGIIKLKKIKSTINWNTNDLNSEFKTYLEQQFKETTAFSRFKCFKLHVQPYFKNRVVSSINDIDVQSFTKKLNKKEYKYKNEIVSVAKAYFSFLGKYGLSSNVPGSDIKIQKKGNIIEKKDFDFYTIKEFNKFLNVIKEPVHRLIFVLLFYYGLRLGELRGLKHKDFDFKNNKLSIQRAVSNKAGQSTAVVVSVKTSNSLREYPLIQIVKDLYQEIYTKIRQDDFLFVGRSKKGILGETSISRFNQEYANKSGLRKIKIHEFRHSCASYLIASGMDYMLVSSWLGHGSVSTTLNIYSHLFPSRKLEVGLFIDKGNF